MLERIALTMRRNALIAAENGNEPLEELLDSVGRALRAEAKEISQADIAIAEKVVLRAVDMIARFDAMYLGHPVISPLNRARCDIS
jgi:hypothetical protein